MFFDIQRKISIQEMKEKYPGMTIAQLFDILNSRIIPDMAIQIKYKDSFPVVIESRNLSIDGSMNFCSILISDSDFFHVLYPMRKLFYKVDDIRKAFETVDKDESKKKDHCFIILDKFGYSDRTDYGIKFGMSVSSNNGNSSCTIHTIMTDPKYDCEICCPNSSAFTILDKNFPSEIQDLFSIINPIITAHEQNKFRKPFVFPAEGWPSNDNDKKTSDESESDIGVNYNNLGAFAISYLEGIRNAEYISICFMDDKHQPIDSAPIIMCKDKAKVFLNGGYKALYEKANKELKEKHEGNTPQENERSWANAKPKRLVIEENIPDEKECIDSDNKDKKLTPQDISIMHMYVESLQHSCPDSIKEILRNILLSRDILA